MLEASLEKCRRHTVTQTILFAAEALLAKLDRDIEAWLSGNPAKINQRMPYRVTRIRGE